MCLLIGTAKFHLGSHAWNLQGCLRRRQLPSTEIVLPSAWTIFEQLLWFSFSQQDSSLEVLRKGEPQCCPVPIAAYAQSRGLLGQHPSVCNYIGPLCQTMETGCSRKGNMWVLRWAFFVHVENVTKIFCK